MLTINVVLEEDYDEERNLFIPRSEYTLQLEHSLATLSKWESKWEKPFLSSEDKTTEETVWYIKVMTMTPDVPPEVFSRISNSNLIEINKYIESKMSATTFNEHANTRSSSSEVVTSEVIYYMMGQLNIPFECENWHLNRLIALIKVCNLKNAPQKKMSPREAAERTRMLNDHRRDKYNTNG